MKHLESCVRRAIEVRTLREQYNEKHTMHCESCEGWGGLITVTDPSLSVASIFGDNSVEVEDCPSCVAIGKCPRCCSNFNNDSDSEDYDEFCTFCNFILGKTEGKPYPHYCLCGELEESSSR